MELFKITNTLTSSDPDVIVNKFNEYFASIDRNLASNIPNSQIDCTNYLPHKIMNSLFIRSTNEAEIIKITKDLKNKSSCGYDGLSTNVIKKIISSISRPLAFIINQSFTHGYFPDALKISKIIPMYKSGSKLEFSNYRPISLLPSFSKIFEQIFA